MSDAKTILRKTGVVYKLPKEKNQEVGSKSLGKKWHFNESTFCLIIFVLSLTVVFTKLLLNFRGSANLQQSKTPTSFVNLVSWNLANFNKEQNFGASSGLVQTATVNTSQLNYNDFIRSYISEEYGWLGWIHRFFKAALCGLGTVAFTWFIIYKDSYKPGINPPFPAFIPTKNGCQEEYRIQINYLLGLMIGVITFVYMCF